MDSDSLRLMVVDDTGLYRKILGDVLSNMDGVDVVGTASNGSLALAKIAHLKPDLLTLDVEMPTMDGLETLRQLRHVAPHIGAIMVSAHTKHGAKTTMDALELGAFDFITKPDGQNIDANVTHLRRQLQPIISTFHTKKHLKALLHGNGASSRPAVPTVPAATRGRADGVIQRMQTLSRNPSVNLIAFGVSTGGPQALACVMPRLPQDLGVPVVVVQHMPPMFTGALAESLNSKSALTVVEACTEQVLEANTVYIAPGGKQMKITQKGADKRSRLLLTNDPPENHCKPSVDYLFRSVAQLYGNRALGVIMTGMGADGVVGLRLMKRQGATVLAQDEASCVVFGMPAEAIKAGVVDVVVPLERMAEEICQRLRKR